MEQVLVGLCKIKERLVNLSLTRIKKGNFKVFREGVAQSGQSRMFLPFRSKVQILSSSLSILNNFANIVKWYNRGFVTLYFQFDPGYWLQFTKALQLKESTEIYKLVHQISGLLRIVTEQGYQFKFNQQASFPRDSGLLFYPQQKETIWN